MDEYAGKHRLTPNGQMLDSSVIEMLGKYLPVHAYFGMNLGQIFQYEGRHSHEWSGYCNCDECQMESL